jgi:phosphoglycolate phosphatase-like HAD superfamily hydrolase
MNWQAIFFDFDGVILDSVDIKTKAFAKMFRPFGSKTESEVIAYHLANKGVSRYEKFKYYYENILKREISEKELDNLGKKFSDLVLKGVIDSPFIEGALETLNKLYIRKIPAYLVSGTPRNEINHIVTEKGISHYFKEVHGTPRYKDEIIKDILAHNEYQPNKCLFIGDAMSDYNAAKKNDLFFLGVVKKDEISPFPIGTTISQCVTFNFSC